MPKKAKWASQKDTYLMDPIAVSFLEHFYKLTVTLHLQLPGTYIVCTIAGGTIDNSFLPEMTVMMPDLTNGHTSYSQLQVGQSRKEIEQYRKIQQYDFISSKTNEEEKGTNNPHNRHRRSISSIFKLARVLGIGGQVPVTAIPHKILQHITPPMPEHSQQGINKAAIQLLRFLSNITSTNNTLALPLVRNTIFERKNSNCCMQQPNLKTDKEKIPMLKFFWKQLKETLSKTFNIGEPLTTILTVLFCIACVMFCLLLLSPCMFISQICYNLCGKHGRRNRRLNNKREQKALRKEREKEEEEEEEIICNKRKMLMTGTENEIDSTNDDNIMNTCPHNYSNSDRARTEYIRIPEELPDDEKNALQREFKRQPTQDYNADHNTDTNFKNTVAIMEKHSPPAYSVISTDE
jgi:hypothetical protein